MADPDPNDPHRPKHPGNFPTMGSGKRRSGGGRRIGMIVGAVVLVALLWWLLGGSTDDRPGQEQTLGEPAGFGTAAAPDAEEGAIDSAADPDDPQAAIGADPHTEPSSPAAAEQAGAPQPGDNTANDPAGTQPGN